MMMMMIDDDHGLQKQRQELIRLLRPSSYFRISFYEIRREHCSLS